jgi:hypothetical protein
MKTWCPRCNQGWIRKMRHRRSGEIVFVCEECEALWREGQAIENTGFQDLQAYFRAKGQSGDWSEMVMLEE